MTIASRTCSTPSISESNDLTNASIPSVRSFFVTSVMSIPAASSAARSSLGSWSAVAPLISARSAAASSVGIGIVLTVCGATSSSTYFVSG